LLYRKGVLFLDHNNQRNRSVSRINSIQDNLSNQDNLSIQDNQSNYDVDHNPDIHSKPDIHRNFNILDDKEIHWDHTLWDPLKHNSRSPVDGKVKNIRVAAYCRVSASKSAESDSLMNQVNHYTQLISRREDWKFIGIYFDENVSGSGAKKRQGFERLMRHCEEGKIDLILVKSVKRFSRNTQQLLETVKKLSEINVSIFFELENIDSSRDDYNFILSTYSGLGQAEVEALSNSVEWGYEKKFLQGRPHITNMLGYKTIDGIVCIVEDQAEVVRQIFTMYLNGMKLIEIARVLMNQGIKTVHGNDLWTGKAVKAILKNVRYTGNAVARKTTRNMFTGVTEPSDNIRIQYYLENSHPAIISQAVFDEVQKLIPLSTPIVRANAHESRPLTRRLICGHCGRCYYHATVDTRTYWRCFLKKTDSKRCAAVTLREDRILPNMLLKAFEMRFGRLNAGLIKYLVKIIKKVSQNDHFEFHRLKALTMLDLARQRRGLEFSDEEIESLKAKYKEFEESLIKLEDDRQLRTEALQWMAGIKSIHQFRAEATISFLRAWILEIVVYSEKDFLVRWIDGEETEIGICVPFEREDIIAASQVKPAQENVMTSIYDKKLTSEPENLITPIHEYEMSPIHENRPTTAHENIMTTEQENIITSITTQNVIAMKEAEALQLQNGKRAVLIPQLTKSIKSSNIIQSSRIGQQHMPMSSTGQLNKRLRVAAYVRVSTENEMQMTSLKTQIAYYTYAILKNPDYEFAGIYADEGITGTSTKNRKGFNKLIKDCQAGKIDMIITKSLSRFARNTVDALTHLKILNELNPSVPVMFENEQIKSTDGKGQLIIELLSAISQEESINIGSSIAWSIRSMAQRGIVKPARLGYGFRYAKNHEWTIDEAEAQIVQRIYDEYLEGKSIQEIAKRLTIDGVPIEGKHVDWSFSMIRRILTSESYRGNYLFQKIHRGGVVEKRCLPNKGELPQYLLENHHPAIIESEKWQRVQSEIVNREAIRRSKIETPYPPGLGKNESLTRKLFCDECGSSIGFVRRRSEEGKFNYQWRCNKAFKSRCSTKHYDQMYLEQNFSQMLIDLMHNPEFSKYIEGAKGELMLDEKEMAEREALKIKMNELNQELYRVVDDEIGKTGRDTKRVDELTEGIVKLRDLILGFDEREERVIEIDEAVKWLKKELMSYNNNEKDEYGFYIHAPEFQSEIFEMVIDKGIIQKDGRIIFKLNAGLEWSAEICYEDYLKRRQANKMAEKQEAKEKYFQSLEIRKLLKYCTIPKTFAEMHEFFGKHSSKDAFRKNIVDPLIETGKLKRLIQNKAPNSNQRYYSGRTLKTEL